MNKKQQAIEVVRSLGMVEQLTGQSEALKSLACSLDKLSDFADDEKQLVREAYAVVLLPSLRANCTAIEELIAAIEGKGAS